jgi:hypothetical protein
MNKPVYEVVSLEMGGEVITRTDPDGKVWFIPQDPMNSDYIAYLASLENQKPVKKTKTT